MYVPYIQVPNQPVPSTITGYTNGTIFTQDYALVLNQIAREINEVGYNFSGAASYDIGSAAASLSAIAINSGSCSERLAEIDQTLQGMAGSILAIANKIEVSTKGLANISTHMGKQNVIAMCSLADQVKANEFNALTANQAQEAAGQEKTVVTPAAFITKIEAAVNDVGSMNSVLGATNLIIEGITAAGTTAFTTATTWAAESAIGTWVIEAYAETEIAVVSMFSKKKAKELELALADKRAKTKTG